MADLEISHVLTVLSDPELIRLIQMKKNLKELRSGSTPGATFMNREMRDRGDNALDQDGVEDVLTRSLHEIEHRISVRIAALAPARLGRV